MTASAASIPVYTVVLIPEGYAVHRNGVVLKTPAGIPFAVPALPLAEAVAEEWRVQTDKPNPVTMPMTQLAATSLDITRKDHNAIIGQVTAYAASELLCHRAEHPEELVLRQQQLWQPVLDWCAQRFDALLQTGQGIMPITQSPEAMQALRRAVEVYDDFNLTGVKQAVEISGSLVLGLALIEQYLTSEQVFHAAELDASFQIQKWGEDPASAKRHETIQRDLNVCERWFGLVDVGAGSV